MSMLEVDRLTRDYGGGKGVFDLTFRVGEGEVFGFLGPNGAGKTTTIRHLMGFIHPQAGSCRIDGMDCWRDRARIQRELGYIPGEIAFFDDMTGEEFLRFLEKSRGRAGAGRKAELLEMARRFGLEPKRLRLVQHDAVGAPGLVLLECRRGGKPGLRAEPTLLLYGPDGRETAEHRRAYFREEEQAL